MNGLMPPNKLYYKSNFSVLFFFGLIILLPFIGIFSKVNYDLNLFFNFFQNSYTHRLIYFSVYQAFISAILSCFLAIPFALALNRHKDLKIIKFIISLCGFCFVIPTILIVYAVIKLFGNNGFYNSYFNLYEYLSIETIFGIKAILIAHILLNTPFATRLFFQSLNSIPLKYYEISGSLNIKFLGNLVKLELPYIKQNFFSVFSIIFSLCFLSFAIVMALGGGPMYSTIEVAIYQYALFELNFNKAILLSFLQIFICLFFLFIGFYKLKGSNFFDIDQIDFTHPHKEYKVIKIIDFLLILFFSIFFFSPILCVIYNFINNGFYTTLINTKFLESFFNSLIISITTAIIVSITGFIISSILVINYKNIFFQQSIFLISSSIIIISPIIFSLGYFIILGELRYLYFFKYLVIILINCLFLLPFSILIIFNNLKNIFLNFESFQQTFRMSLKNYFIILLPLIRKNLIFVFAFSTVITFGDFTIISFFKDQDFDTLPSYLYKLISVYKFNEASFVAGIILILSMIIFLTIDNLNYQGKSVIKT